MTKQLLMGNQAAAMAAIAAGVNVVAGYPGTPSTEVLETVARNNPGDIYVEWSTNEKAAMEVAVGASWSGARTLVTCKQMGLNVASDPLMCLAYMGIKGGFVVYVADDPGPISSQTEQDTRAWGRFAKVIVLDPSNPEEVYEMVGSAFELSERYGKPVIVRPTTRVCHATAAIEVAQRTPHAAEGFVRDPSRWVIFPRLAYNAHLDLCDCMPRIAEDPCDYPLNAVYDVASHNDDDGQPRCGIATGGVSDAYTQEALFGFDETYRMFHVATPNPFPEALALEFLAGLDEVIVFEELDPVIEDELVYLCGKHHLDVRIRGKRTGDTLCAGENSVEAIRAELARYFARVGKTAAWRIDSVGPDKLRAGEAGAKADTADADMPALPVRPPVLCAGCPHRGSFYAVKQALKGRKAFFTGDIGCYTLGNAAPLNTTDTCLCMGADITIAQGMHRAEPDAAHIAFIGDSTFFASGVTGVIDAYYNQTDITIALTNGTTAMTGQQPHPGTGQTMMGATHAPVSIEGVLRGIGLTCVEHANPFDLSDAIEKVSALMAFEGSLCRDLQAAVHQPVQA